MNNNQRINQLLMQTRGLSSTNLEGTALIERLRKEAFALAAWSCREIDRITAERDEARRAVCCSALPSDYKEWKPEIVDAMVRMIAAQEGWDCYKEEQ